MNKAPRFIVPLPSMIVNSIYILLQASMFCEAHCTFRLKPGLLMCIAALLLLNIRYRSCRDVVYCDKDCQRTGWQFHKHCCEPQTISNAKQVSVKRGSNRPPPIAGSYLDTIEDEISRLGIISDNYEDPVAATAVDIGPEPSGADNLIRNRTDQLMSRSSVSVQQRILAEGWPLRLQMIPNAGTGVVATRPIDSGELVLEDEAVAAVPQAQ